MTLMRKNSLNTHYDIGEAWSEEEE